MAFPVGTRMKDWVGFQTNNLRVIEHSHIKRRSHYWLCECKHCGNEFACVSSQLEIRQSCGCITRNSISRKLSKEDSVSEFSLQWLRRAWV